MINVYIDEYTPCLKDSRTGEVFENYNKYLSTMEAPIMPSSLPKCKIRFSDLVKYAKEHNIDIASLSAEEKEELIKIFKDNSIAA